jgi:integrase
LIGLLASTGLRVSEALALRVDDIGADGLRVIDSKLHKSRLVPMHSTTAAALKGYLRRRRGVRTSTDRIFVNLAGEPLSYSNVQKAFFALRGKALHRDTVTASPAPRIHDLRHTFAVRALEAAPIGSQLLGRHMRALSTYMGHVDFRSTYWYLQATPLLMRRVADVCQSLFDGESP